MLILMRRVWFVSILLISLSVLSACPGGEEAEAPSQVKPTPSPPHGGPEQAATSQTQSPAVAGGTQEPLESSATDAFGGERDLPELDGETATGEADSEELDARVAAWREDLEVLAEELPRRHKNLYFELAPARFMAAVDLLREDIPYLDDHEIIVHLMRLVAMPGDSHTALDINSSGFHAFPLQLYWFEDGLFVIGTDARYADALGLRLSAIDGVDIEEAIGHVSTVFPYENYAQLTKQAPSFLVLAEVLHTIGVTAQIESAEFTFTDDYAEESFNLTIEAVAAVNHDTWMHALDPIDPSLPVYLEQQFNPYFCKYLPDLRMLFLQYNGCVERSDLPFADFVGLVDEMVVTYEFEYFVIDLRFNSGGDSSIADPLIDYIAGQPEVNQRGTLFVVIGRNTFSSAVLNALAFQRETESLLAGEPTGGKPNHFGEVQAFTLPNSGMDVYYSTKYFTPSDSDDDSLMPDIPAVEFSSDYFSYVDPAIDAILDFTAQ